MMFRLQVHMQVKQKHAMVRANALTQQKICSVGIPKVLDLRKFTAGGELSQLMTCLAALGKTLWFTFAGAVPVHTLPNN